MRRSCILAVVSALAVTGCARHTEPELTFAVGGAPSETVLWESVVDDFTQRTGIPVQIVRQPTDSDQRRQGLVIPLMARKADPDVFLMDVAWLSQFAASGWLEPLEPYLAAEDVQVGSFFERVIDLVDRHRGSLQALPVYVDAGLLYYRKDLLERHGIPGPPETWDELVSVALRIQEAERASNPKFYGFLWQGAQYEGLICTFLEFAASRGGGMPMEDGTPVLDTPANVAAAQFMRDLIHRYRISPPNTYTEMREEEVRTMFQAGHALFERNWPYAWSLHQGADSPVRNRVGVAPLPRGASGRHVGTLGGWHIGISRFADAKPQAAALVAHIVSYDTQKRLALEAGWNPGRRDLYENAELLERMPHLEVLRRAMEGSEPRPIVPYYSQLSDVMRRHLNAVLADQATPEEALARAAVEAGRVAKRYASDGD